jgi:hypothetical protein
MHRWAEWVWLLLDHIQRQQAVICCLNTISSWFKLSGDNSWGHTAIVNEKYLLSTGLPYHHMVHSCRVRLTAFSSLTTLDLDTDSIFIRSIASQLTSGWPWISGWWGGWREGDGRLHTIAVRCDVIQVLHPHIHVGQTIWSLPVHSVSNGPLPFLIWRKIKKQMLTKKMKRKNFMIYHNGHWISPSW